MKEKTLLLLSLVCLLACCTNKKNILEITTSNDLANHNSILFLVESANVPTITDSLELSRFIFANQMRTAFDSTVYSTTDGQKVLRLERKFSGTILKTPNYQTDLLLTINNESNDRDYSFMLRSFDNNRNKVGHLDFASWRNENHWSGKIDSDTIVEIKCDETGEQRKFKITETGNFVLLSTNKKEK